MKEPKKSLRLVRSINRLIMGTARENRCKRLPEFGRTGNTQPKNKKRETWPKAFPATVQAQTRALNATRKAPSRTGQLNNQLPNPKERVHWPIK